ncbi:FliI/YscN family ATPase [Spirochaetes bacterium]|uniref:FliI/YscN family ATPase n=1 Tax=Candidatus Scatousia excrementipullorum TaxID=2840936 RepID=A0A9D9DQS7_9BACT|nr:FliI/YscN family ATPase [Candidatus Scatousia excrementipullorum]
MVEIDDSYSQYLKQRVHEVLEQTQLFQFKGTVSKLLGLTVEVKLPGLKVGDLCYIETYDGQMKPAEVQAFKGEAAQLLLLYDGEGIGQGSLVTSTGRPIIIPVGDFLLGRLINPMGEPIDGMPLDTTGAEWRPIEGPPPGPFERPIITEIFSTGVRAIDSCMTMGCGQRLGLFAGSGVGKSTLLGMIARNSDADVNVVALIGERGREVKEFVEDALGEEGMKKSVLVCSTGDQPPLIRQKALLTATAVCEYFRDQGKKVFLMTDTVTRCAMAGREVGLSLGEPPTMKGYPPSIFSWLQKVLERAGNSPKGSITALYTVLMEGDDISDPIVDIVRGIVDGHIFLSRKVAEMNHYPAIDVLGSISRLMSSIVTPEHKAAAGKMRQLLALYRENKDLIDVGMYQPGSNPRLDVAIQMNKPINDFLQQRTSDIVSMDTTIQTLVDMMKDVDI